MFSNKNLKFFFESIEINYVFDNNNLLFVGRVCSIMAYVQIYKNCRGITTVLEKVVLLVVI